MNPDTAEWIRRALGAEEYARTGSKKTCAAFDIHTGILAAALAWSRVDPSFFTDPPNGYGVSDHGACEAVY